MAGCLIAIVLAVAAVIIVVLTTLGGSGDGAADSPTAAAQAWGKAALSHDTSRLTSLSCPSAKNGFGIYGLVFNGSGVKAGSAVANGHDTWDVPLTTTGPGGGTTIHVKVEKHGDNYLVC